MSTCLSRQFWLSRHRLQSPWVNLSLHFKPLYEPVIPRNFHAPGVNTMYVGPFVSCQVMTVGIMKAPKKKTKAKSFIVGYQTGSIKRFKVGARANTGIEKYNLPQITLIDWIKIKDKSTDDFSSKTKMMRSGRHSIRLGVPK